MSNKFIRFLFGFSLPIIIITFFHVLAYLLSLFTINGFLLTITLLSCFGMGYVAAIDYEY